MIKSLGLIGKTSKSCSLSATVCVVLGLALLPVHAQVTAETKARKLLRENRLEEALVAIDIELKERPSEGPLWLLKGAALSMSDRKDDAVLIFKRMIQDKMEVASAYNNLGVIYSERGDFEAARLALESAVRSKPDYAVALRNLGNVYANLAGMSYKRALQLDGTDQSLVGKLAQLGDMLGKKFDQLVGPQFAGSAEPLPEPRRTPAPRIDASQYASSVTIPAEPVNVASPAPKPSSVALPAEPVNVASLPAPKPSSVTIPAEPVVASSPPAPKPEPYVNTQVSTQAVSYAPARAEPVRPPAPRQNSSVASAKPKAPVTFEWQTASTPTRGTPSRISPMVVAASAATTYSQPQQPAAQQTGVPDLWSSR